MSAHLWKYRLLVLFPRAEGAWVEKMDRAKRSTDQIIEKHRGVLTKHGIIAGGSARQEFTYSFKLKSDRDRAYRMVERSLHKDRIPVYLEKLTS